MWQKFDDFDPETNFGAWARTIARNKVRSFWQLRRHNSVHFGAELGDLVDGLIAAKADVLDAQFDALADCLNRLSNRDQHMIELRYRAGDSVRTLAQKVSRSPDAIYKALRRIHAALLDCVRKATAEAE